MCIYPLYPRSILLIGFKSVDLITTYISFRLMSCFLQDLEIKQQSINHWGKKQSYYSNWKYYIHICSSMKQISLFRTLNYISVFMELSLKPLGLDFCYYLHKYNELYKVSLNYCKCIRCVCKKLSAWNWRKKAPSLLTTLVIDAYSTDAFL